MLELRPGCENCDKDLPPDSTDAMICTFECTFCVDCVENILLDVCPNCGGGFVPRPTRPATEWRKGVSLAQHPASVTRVHKPVDIAEHDQFAVDIKNIDAINR
jgi:hypothetical protein